MRPPIGYDGDFELLERVQRTWTKALRGLDYVPYGQKIRKLDLFSYWGRLLCVDLLMFGEYPIRYML